MRWTVVLLVLANVVFLLWNWLGYSYTRSRDAMNQSYSGEERMPGTRLILLKERSEVVFLPVEGGAPSAAAEVSMEGAVEQQSATCLLLGPYSDPSAANALIERLRSLQIEGRYALVDVEGQPDYWVYLRPAANRELALAKLRELQDKRIDSFVIPEGEIANGISLGVFDSEESADKRRQEVIAFGYSPEIIKNIKRYKEGWVVISPVYSSQFSPELFGQLKSENAQLDLRKDDCAKVASQ